MISPLFQWRIAGFLGPLEKPLPPPWPLRIWKNPSHLVIISLIGRKLFFDRPGGDCRLGKDFDFTWGRLPRGNPQEIARSFNKAGYYGMRMVFSSRKSRPGFSWGGWRRTRKTCRIDISQKYSHLQLEWFCEVYWELFFHSLVYLPENPSRSILCWVF